MTSEGSYPTTREYYNVLKKIDKRLSVFNVLPFRSHGLIEVRTDSMLIFRDATKICRNAEHISMKLGEC